MRTSAASRDQFQDGLLTQNLESLSTGALTQSQRGQNRLPNLER